jgi:hypothetical protein
VNGKNSLLPWPKVKAKVLEKLHEELSYMAKVMPVNEYRASWLNEVINYT